MVSDPVRVLLVEARPAGLEVGEIELHPGPVDVADAAGECVDRGRLAAAAKKIKLKFEVRAGERMVRADETRIGQVLAVLLSNAVKSTPSGGSVHVAVDPQPESVHVIVTDSGPGIPRAELSRLFTRFGVLSTRPTAGESGAGMGLYVARELMAHHGGHIEVDSPPGRGATFRCVIPRAEAADPAKTKRSDPVAPPPLAARPAHAAPPPRGE